MLVRTRMHGASRPSRLRRYPSGSLDAPRTTCVGLRTEAGRSQPPGSSRVRIMGLGAGTTKRTRTVLDSGRRFTEGGSTRDLEGPIMGLTETSPRRRDRASRDLEPCTGIRGMQRLTSINACASGVEVPGAIAGSDGWDRQRGQVPHPAGVIRPWIEDIERAVLATHEVPPQID